MERSTFYGDVEDMPDLKIRIDGYEWLVHSKVLSKQSAFFERVCNGPFKESKRKVIDLHDDNPWIVAWLIQWFYCDEHKQRWVLDCCDHLEEMLNQSSVQGHQLPNHETYKDVFDDLDDWERQVALYKIADKYGIQTLTEATRGSLAPYPGVFAFDFDMRETVEYIGVDLVKRDQVLFGTILEAAYSGTADFGGLYKQFEMVFESDKTVMDAVLSFFFEKSKHDKNEILDLFCAVCEARQSLSLAMSVLKQRINNDKWKLALENAEMVLWRAQHKRQGNEAG